MTTAREALVELVADHLGGSRLIAATALDALSAAPSELLWPVLMPWRPMETVPRDEEVLARTAAGETAVGTMVDFGKHAQWQWQHGFISWAAPLGWLPLPPPGDAP